MTADEGAIGQGHLSRFQELETLTPVILTTSQLLTTGVDVQTCKRAIGKKRFLQAPSSMADAP